MLEVTQILEGGFDCRTGQRLGKGVVLSNGVEEVNLQLEDNQVEAVVGLFAQALARRGINPHEEPVSEFAAQPQVVRELEDPGDGAPVQVIIPPPPVSEDPDFPGVTHALASAGESAFTFAEDEHELEQADVQATPHLVSQPPPKKSDAVAFEPLSNAPPLAMVAGEEDRDGPVAEDGLSSL